MIAESFAVSFNLIKVMIFDVVKSIGPTAIAITGVFLAWKLGIKFFRKLISGIPDSYDKEGNEQQRRQTELDYLKDEYERHTDNEIFDDDDQWRDEEW